MSDFDIYLASASPRRRELLEQVGIQYKLLTVSVDEAALPTEAAEDYVQRIALHKARAGQQILPADDHHPVLGADTAVVVDGQILGKPRDRAHALGMLQLLSARRHQVMSAVAVINAGEHVRLNVSTVTFRDISPAETEAYWESGECRDKAGAYAIQGYAAAFIRHLEGSYSGVMGLPLYETIELLQAAGVRIPGI